MSAATQKIAFFTKPYMRGGVPDNVEIFYREADGTEKLAYSGIHQSKAHVAIQFLTEGKDKLRNFNASYQDKELRVLASDYHTARRLAGDHFCLSDGQWQSLTVLPV